MPDSTRDAFIRRMIDEGTSDDDIIATLKVFDQRAAQSKLPTRPVTAEDFMTPDQIRNADSGRGWPATIGEIIKGGLKGLGRTAVGIGEMAMTAGLIPGQARGALLDPSMEHPVIARAKEALTAENIPQKVGGLAEFAAETAVPAARVVTALPAAIRALPNVAAKVSPAALDALEFVPGIGGWVSKGRKAAKYSGRLSEALDTVIGNTAAPAEAAAPTPVRLGYGRESGRMGYGYERPVAVPEPVPIVPEPVVSPNAGGRLVPRTEPTVEEAVSGVLDELAVPTPPARITTPPPADLPPGYTPRTSVPKPKAAPRAPVAPEPPVEAPVAPPKRAYFLRDVPAKVVDDAVAPSDLSDLSQYPASWQPRTGQDVIPAARQTRTVASRKAAPVTAAEVDEVASSLMAQGLSPSEAMQAVMQNRQLPPELRASLMTALGKLKKRAS